MFHFNTIPYSPKYDVAFVGLQNRIKSAFAVAQMCEISTELLHDRSLFHRAISQVTNRYGYDDICNFNKDPLLHAVSIYI